MRPDELVALLRTELPRLLREHPEVRYEVWGIFLEAFPSRQEYTQLLEEIRALREDMVRRFEASDRRFEAMDRRFEAMDRRFEELRLDMDRRFEAVDRRFEAMDRRFEELRLDMDRRFEAVDRRFEAMDRRFEAMLAELRETRERADRRFRELELHLSSLGVRVGRGLEHVIREVVEEFSGQTFAQADRLVLVDREGVVYGVAGARVEFDLYAADGTAYLVEVKSHVKPADVLTFHKKAEFASRELGRPVRRLIIALSMEEEAERLMARFGIEYRVRTRVEPDRETSE